MEIEDLAKFIVLANCQNMQQAAAHFQTSPSVISKSLKRLEQQMKTQLFARVGKHIQLNPQGQQLLPEAVALVNQAKQVKGLFASEQTTSIRIAGPAIILTRWASVLARSVGSESQLAKTQLSFNAVYEQAALDAVLNGTSDIALITTELSAQLPSQLPSIALGSLPMVVASASHHPLAKGKVWLTDIQGYDFVVPQRSLFCGEARGVGCDGWNNHVTPRNMPVVADDLSVMAQLIKSGMYLGYVPSYWAREQELAILAVNEPLPEPEQILAVSWQPDLLSLFGVM